MAARWLQELSRLAFVNVRSVFRAAVQDGLIVVDPTEGERLPRPRRREATMSIPTPGEVGLLLEAADDLFVGFIAVCAFAGLRLGEAAGRQVGDVDFLCRQPYVRRQCSGPRPERSRSGCPSMAANAP